MLIDMSKLYSPYGRTNPKMPKNPAKTNIIGSTEKAQNISCSATVKHIASIAGRIVVTTTTYAQQATMRCA